MVTFSGVLTGILLAPVFGAVVILLLKKDSKEQARIIAATTMGVALVLALGVFFGFDTDAANQAAENGQTYFGFEDHVQWVESVGIGWHLGVDGISAAMVLLTALAGFAGVLISWGIEDRPRVHGVFPAAGRGVFGVFMAVDLFVVLLLRTVDLPMYFPS
jgi:NADH-quinone oxidoreductase subunit M